MIKKKENELERKLFEWIKNKNLPEKEIPKENKEWIGIEEWEIGHMLAAKFSGIKYDVDHIYKRLDCVCIINNERAWIIEFKRNLNYEAIGQVLVYKDVFEMEYPEYAEVKMGIACEKADHFLKNVAEKIGIKVFSLYMTRKTTKRKTTKLKSWEKELLEWIKKENLPEKEIPKKRKEMASATGNRKCYYRL